MRISAKHFLFGALTAGILLFSFIFSQPDGQLHVVFCDVGQGDAIYIKFPDGKDALVDGGPNNKVLSCLGRHMAFYDRTIEFVALSHPQADHFSGLIEVMKRYTVDLFVTSPIGNSEAKSYQTLIELVKDKGISVQNIYSKDEINDAAVKITTLWPEHSFIAANTPVDTSSLDVLGAQTNHQDLNDFVIVFKLSYGSFDVLLTGDAEADILNKALTIHPIDTSANSIEVLKVAHHGSKNSLTTDLLTKIKPKLAVISVGKNSYGHPTQVILDMLTQAGIEIKRTDQSGDIEVVSDGEKWWVR